MSRFLIFDQNSHGIRGSQWVRRSKNLNYCSLNLKKNEFKRNSEIKKSDGYLRTKSLYY